MDQRYLFQPIQDHLNKMRQMVFLVGPRQVGKTTLAKTLIPEPYYNWDSAIDRRFLLKHYFTGVARNFIPPPERVVFDEIHKYPRWKNSLKGLFDHYEPNTHWIITGSARLDIHRRGQDSLVGRAFTYHLNPLSLAELTQKSRSLLEQSWSGLPAFDSLMHPLEDEPKVFERLLEFGGFPEPFYKASKSFLKKWQSERLSLIIFEDLAKIENLKNSALLEQLALLLIPRTAQLLSINSLREELEVHFETVKHWITLLERVFYGWRLYPFSAKLPRSLQKEPKWYLWDWTEAETTGARFENCVAVHLLKYTQYITDLGLAKLSLRFIRNKEKKEIDFVLLEGNRPVAFIECKWSDHEIDSSLYYYQTQFPKCRFIQLVGSGFARKQMRGNVEIWPASEFLAGLV